MASKKSKKPEKFEGFAPKQAQEKFAGAVEKARQPIGPVERPVETQVEPDMKRSRRKNDSESPFVKKNA